MCPFCNERMKGRLLCERHNKEISLRAGSYNLSRGDAMDQLWDMYEEEFAIAFSEREQELAEGNGYPFGTIGAETR